MKTILSSALAAGLVFSAAGVGATGAMAADMTVASPAPSYEAPDSSGGVRIGYLDCTIDGGVGYVLGSAKSVDCEFRPTMTGDSVDHYTGTIRKLGVDLGFTTRQRLVWCVVAPTAGYHRGSLGGLYKGATAEATVGVGVGTNVLVGGTAGSIQLQTVSLTGQVGLNVAATGTSITLEATN